MAALGEAGLAQRLGRDLGARVEPRVEVGHVHRLGARPEGLEGHRHLLVRPAQLARAHVDRVLAALVGCPSLRSRAGARALVPAPRGLAGTGSGAAADALASLTRAGLGSEAVEADVLGIQRAHEPSPPETSTRWPTVRIMP